MFQSRPIHYGKIVLLVLFATPWCIAIPAGADVIEIARFHYDENRMIVEARASAGKYMSLEDSLRVMIAPISTASQIPIQSTRRFANPIRYAYSAYGEKSVEEFESLVLPVSSYMLYVSCRADRPEELASDRRPFVFAPAYALVERRDPNTNISSRWLMDLDNNRFLRAVPEPLVGAGQFDDSVGFIVLQAVGGGSLVLVLDPEKPDGDPVEISCVYDFGSPVPVHLNDGSRYLFFYIDEGSMASPNARILDLQTGSLYIAGFAHGQPFVSWGPYLYDLVDGIFSCYILSSIGDVTIKWRVSAGGSDLLLPAVHSFIPIVEYKNADSREVATGAAAPSLGLYDARTGRCLGEIADYNLRIGSAICAYDESNIIFVDAASGTARVLTLLEVE